MDNVTEQGTKRGFSGSTLKIVAIISMLIDHTAAIVIERYMNSTGAYELIMTGDPAEWLPQYGVVYTVYTVMRAIGRLGFPLFGFLLIEGFTHTGNRLKYAVRLGVFALISEIPFNLGIMNNLTDLTYQNVFFTLFLAFLALWWCDYIWNKEIGKTMGMAAMVASSLLMGIWTASRFVSFEDRVPFTVLVLIATMVVWISQYRYGYVQGIENLRKVSVCATGVAALMFFAEFLRTDYSGLGILAIVAAYVYRNKKTGSFIAEWAVLTVFNFFEIFAIGALPFVKHYNGKRGLNIKYIFYAFYPAHLLILHLISWMLGYIPGPFGF